MSVFIHVGQCGNQIGSEFWNLIQNEGKKKIAMADFIHSSNGKPRCILVDTEPKVITRMRKQNLHYSVENIHFEQYGRGNNWAMGYFGRSNETCCPEEGTLLEKVMESLRKEIETMDIFQTCFISHSIGGGTGAGLGCRILETIRETYPKPYLMSIAVGPSSCGDSPLQNYNSVLTFSKLQQFADCVLYKENEDLIRSVTYWKSVSSSRHSSFTSSSSSSSSSSHTIATTTISLVELNKLVALDIAGLILPTCTSTGGPIRPFDPSILMHSVCPLPTAKFVDVRTLYTTNIKSTNKLYIASIPHTVETNLQSMFHTLKKSIPRQNVFNTSSRSLSSVVLARGIRTNSLDLTRDAMELLGKSNRHVEWNPRPWYGISDPSFLPLEPTSGVVSSLTLCSNRNTIVNTVDRVLTRAKCQYDAKAYLHWYAKYGCHQEQFRQAFENCQGIVDEYHRLTHS